jgi:hypothetical protein
MAHSLTQPKLRNINVQRIEHQGQPVFLMQDGLRLTDAAIVLPQALGPFAMLCDGQHTLPEMQVALDMQYGLRLSTAIMQDMIAQFDNALLLDSEKFQQARQQAIKDYRSAPHRTPALAGAAYPAQPKALRTLLDGYLAQVDEVTLSPAGSRGIASPHIDYPRGGPVYAHVWASAAEAVREAELIIVFGTDHNGDFGRLTLTPQHYATPLGTMPTDQTVVNKLVDILGPEAAFTEELHHRGEHSIELVLVWLQHMRQANPCPMVPILTGSFHHYMTGDADIAAEQKFTDVIAALRDEMKQRRTVVVASGDLAHMGPAFGEAPLSPADHAQMVVDDEAMLANLCQGEARGYLEYMKGGPYARNVCGLAPFYFTLSLLGKTSGQTLAYNRCPADEHNTSYVSVAGLVWQ